MTGIAWEDGGQLALCAWCAKEGFLTVLRAGDPQGQYSHGICKDHERLLLPAARAMKNELNGLLREGQEGDGI